MVLEWLSKCFKTLLISLWIFIIFSAFEPKTVEDFIPSVHLFRLFLAYSLYIECQDFKGRH